MSETMADGDAPMRDTHIDTDDDTTTTMTATTMTTTKRQLLVARARQLDCPNTFNGCSSLFSVAACAKARAAATAAPRYTCSVHVCQSCISRQRRDRYQPLQSRVYLSAEFIPYSTIKSPYRGSILDERIVFYRSKHL